MTQAVAPVRPASAPAGDNSLPDWRRSPQNTEAEQGLLGAILVNNKAYEKVSEFLQPEHFFDPAHARIYDAVRKLVERGQVADPVTLKAFFERDGDLTSVGGAAYLAELAASMVTIINAEHYGRLIHEMSLRRQLIDVSTDVINKAYAPEVEETAHDLIEQAEKHLFDMATTGEVKGGFVPFRTSLEAAIRTAEKAFRRDTPITGVTMGLRDLDRKLGGLQPSDLIILAGRPSMGKTALATNMAFNAARSFMQTGGREGATVGFFSLEMSSEQLANRILGSESSVPSDKIRRGEIRDSDFPRFVEASQRLSQVPFFVDDTPGLSIAALRTRARRLKRTSGLGMLVVDYLQLLRGSGTGSSENRVQEVSEITRGLKGIAKELDVPVLALSQLSRAVEQREDKRPQLADLRESGSIEQDADVVMFIFRQQYYLEREEPTKRVDESDEKFNTRHDRWKQLCEEVHNTSEVVIAKQRHGPIGSVRLFFDGAFTRFADLGQSHSDGD
ncbi:MAG: replicative DNA helicase [Pseudomonadota bacterium]|nr:replicative DNA helicase [Pseudomonadota bacterium]